MITEIFFYSDEPTARDPEFEWFELYNPSASNTIHMETMKITRKNPSTGDYHFVVGSPSAADPVTVGPGERVVFCYDEDEGFSLPEFDNINYPGCDYSYGVDNSYTTAIPSAFTWSASFVLTQNSNTTILIEAGGGDFALTTVDSVNYGVSSPWPGFTQGSSIELSEDHLDATDNNTGSYWCLTDGTMKYFNEPGSNDQYGTPGIENTCTGP